MNRLTFIGCLLLGSGVLWAQSTINPTQKFAWAANAGWIDLRTSPENGVVVGAYVCSGFGYGANIGWIHLGDGTPEDHVRYSNANGTDYGVNVQPGGFLRGLAYGANVGWLMFESSGNPRVDLSTGLMSGFIWGANIGWINLGNMDFQVVVDSLQSSPDTDNDQIPDAWEYLRTGSLGFLSLNGDLDHDGVSDRNEYQSDTDPLSSADTFSVMLPQVEKLPNGDMQVTLTWRSSPDREYVIEAIDDLTGSMWMDAGMGPIKPDAGSQTTRTITGPPGVRRFYRARVLLPLQP
ncbi:hypothetical protein [Prosthecobacter sp.]|uniref:hypothetical protein n=1 Tax=Prosthecobacter sp. TaxID=1965333 RepID=UPI001DE38364|nr:hypothetical protein [Prosthecobacter sp.]MCB1275326.1 hypothetical protein [Prosthecobacter sp.]